MTRNEITKAQNPLKQATEALSPEIQNILHKAKQSGHAQFLGYNGWTKPICDGSDCNPNEVYRVDPNTKPEVEYEDLALYVDEYDNCYTCETDKTPMCLSVALSHVRFLGIVYEDGSIHETHSRSHGVPKAVRLEKP